MKKSIKLSLFFLTFVLQTVISNAYYDKIDSLEKLLPALSGKEKLGALNWLSKQYRATYPEKCIDYGNQAVKLAKQLKDRKSEVEATLYIGAGYSYMINPNKALDNLNSALKMCEEIQFLEGISFAYRYIGIAHGALGDLNKAIEYYEKAIVIGEKINYYEGLAHCYSNIAETCWGFGDVEKIVNNMQKAIYYYEKNGNENEAVNSLLKIGDVYKNNGNNDKAFEYFYKAVNHVKPNEKSADNALSLMAIGYLYYGWGENEKAVYYANQALDILKNCGKKFEYATALSQVAQLYGFVMKDYDKALKMNNEALSIYQQMDHKQMIGMTLTEIGKLYMTVGNSQKALEYFNKSYNVAKENNYFINISNSLNDIAKVYIKTKDFEKALDYTNQAMEMRESINNKLGLMVSYSDLGMIYYSQKNYRKSNDYYDKALSISKELKNKEIEKDVYLNLSENYLKLNDYKTAYKYNNLYSAINDSLNKAKSSSQVSDTKIKYEIEKKNKEILLYKKDNELTLANQKYYMIVLASGLIILAFLFIFFFARFRLKKKASIALEQKNMELNSINTKLIESEKHLMELNFAKDKYLSIINLELVRAKEYVMSLLPLPQRHGHIKTDWVYAPSTQLGGDSFGYHWIDDNNFAIYLLDVCGNGVGSALHSVSVLNALRFQTLPNTDFKNPEEVLKALNSAFQMKAHNKLFFTIWYGVFNKETRQLKYSSAGHPPAILINTDKKIQKLRLPNFSIGGIKHFDFTSDCTSIENPATLYIFSDGVYETRFTEFDDWDLDNLVSLLSGFEPGNGMSANEIYNHVKEVHKNNSMEDDFSLVKIQFS